MGGDVAVAAAGHDARINAVAALVATPDWLRPGMRYSWDPGQPLVDQGEADSYAQFFYDAFNPLTHLENYERLPNISFECAAEDRHVPPMGAVHFLQAIEDKYPNATQHIRVNLHKGLTHMDVVGPDSVFWKEGLQWFMEH